MSTKITIPVELVAQSESMQAIVKQLENSTSSINLTSSLGKQYTALLRKIKKESADYTTLVLNPTIDKNGLKAVSRSYQNFSKYLFQIRQELNSAGLFDFNLTDTEKNSLNSVTNKIKELQRELRKINEMGSSKSVEDFLTSIGRADVLDNARKVSRNFKSSNTFKANIKSIEGEAASAKDNYSRLLSRKTELESAESKLQSQASELLKLQEEANERFKTTQDIINKSEFLSKFAGLDKKILRTEGGQLRKQTAVLNAIMEPFNAKNQGGYLSQKNYVGAEQFLQYLGVNKKLVGDLLTKPLEDIRKFIADRLGIKDGSTEVVSDKTNTQLRHLQKQVDFYTKKNPLLGKYDILAKEKEEVDIHSTKLNQIQKELGINKAEQNLVTDQIEATRILVKDLTNLSESLRGFKESLESFEKLSLEQGLDTQIEESKKQESNIRSKYARPIRNIVSQNNDFSFIEENAGRLLEEQEQAEREAEQFKQGMKQAVNQWFGTQQLVSMIKNGLHQAWTDIQGLDEAMTNIAVVTDMNVSDLWGKINDYMAIAQEYGVTTKGVYEVSQLYYQQGLSASEVMAATTETLKLARIANMDYKSSADAMTVAIRAFKMDMSEAQHVTDVYSKVAAVTASDSQELATAMSKTASSAESVGSSFESTTAMLAVMINAIYSTVPYYRNVILNPEYAGSSLELFLPSLMAAELIIQVW